MAVIAADCENYLIIAVVNKYQTVFSGKSDKIIIRIHGTFHK